ncbi:MAG: hypothetical protein KatS3mg105_2064 [Gemmatales bacterium]|nr:MAG: hypothetical protein KatS3mg105_2064 [Gemmatales bacterium]
MALKDGRRDVTAALPPFRPDLGKLAALAQGRASLFKMTYRQCAATCGVEYTPQHHEIEMWVLALMFSEYTADLILDKAEDGHCYAHKPCNATSAVHLQMARDFKKQLEELVNEIGDRIDAVQDIVNSRKASPRRGTP